MLISRSIIATLGAAGLVLASSIAFAQQQPPETEKPKEITVDVPPQEPGAGREGGFLDRMEDIADELDLVERLSGDIDGWYPRIGGMTRGSGFAIGPGYRLHVFDDRVFVGLSAGMSIKGYKAVDANVRWLQALDERLELWTDFRYEDFPQEDFFGMGLDSSPDNRTSYAYASNDFVLRGLYHPISWLRAGSTFGYLQPKIGRGKDKNYPSIEELFTDAQAPGLAVQPDFMYTTFFGEVDYRDTRATRAAAASTARRSASGTTARSSSSITSASMRWPRSICRSCRARRTCCPVASA